MLPNDERKAQELVLGKAQFTMVDKVLYWMEPDKTVRVVVPESD